MSLRKRYYIEEYGKLKTFIYSFACSFIFISALLLLYGKNPFLAFYYIGLSNVSSVFAFSEIFVRATPLLLVSLGTVVAFRARFWNLAGDAQFYVGALVATVIGLARLHWPIHPVLCLIFGGLAGSVIGVFAATLKTKLKVDEVVVTLMLNFIIFYFLSLLLQTIMRNPNTNWPESEYIRTTALLPVLLSKTRFHLGIIIAFAFVPFMDFLLNKTLFGKEIIAIGLNPKAAKLNKIDVKKNLIKVGFLSGFLCGIAGAIEILGVHHHLTTNISANYGIYGIIISTASMLSVYGAALLSILFSFLINGSTSLARFMQIPSFVADVISSFVLIAVAIFSVFEKYKLVIEWKK